MGKKILTLIILLNALTSCGKDTDSPNISVEQQTDITSKGKKKK